ncbi:hypothetical protein GOP47_0013241 [Adiantum capillus-veneris]|uniref:Bidirectional sugar transporter SWEET n=1 Tax=Adiantum capillus-veneris TaxID=13818 RepID=A0A9D4ZF43_ADICA|nr:hypothetical protein GOP47_0013241 [Adiantum capillus-veneris]
MALGVIPLAIGIIGNVLSVLAFCSTIPTFWRIVKKKSVENFSDHPYIFSLLSALLWGFYGLLTLKNGGLMLVVINGIGCIFQYAYLALYVAFSPPHKQMVTGAFVAGVHLSVMAIVVMVKFFLKEENVRLRVMGICSSMAAIAMFGSPLSIMGLVICTKSVEYMPFLLSLAFALRTGIWCAYSYAIHDIYLEVTNTIGTALGLVQLILYMIYHRKPPRKACEKDVRLQEAQSGHIDGDQGGSIHISTDNCGVGENIGDKTETKV